jgi:hypothetical protein
VVYPAELIPMPITEDAGIRSSQEACDAGRRAFLGALATATAALAVPGCSSPVETTSSSSSSGSNVAPAWATIPTVTFVKGVASSFAISPYVSDANGNPLALTVTAGSLPAGVTFDPAGKRFSYDGNGNLAVANGVVLSADDGQA